MKDSVLIVTFLAAIILFEGVLSDCTSYYDDDDDYWSYDCDDDWDYSWLIIGVCIGILIFISAIGTLACFCCAWCCFRGRNTKGQVFNQTAYVSSPQNPGQFQTGGGIGPNVVPPYEPHPQGMPPPVYPQQPQGVPPPDYPQQQQGWVYPQGPQNPPAYPESTNPLQQPQPANQIN